MAKKTIQNKWAQNSSNVQTFTEEEVAAGIEYKGAVVSNQLNGVAADLYEFADNLQRAGTAWNPLKSYEIGDVVEVRAVLNGEQTIAKFACVEAGKSAPLVDSGATSFILDDSKNVCVFTITDDGTKTLKAYCGTAWALLKSGGLYTRSIVDVIYPVGAIYTTLNEAFDPNTEWKGTSWTKIKSGLFLEATDGETQVSIYDSVNKTFSQGVKAPGTETEAGLPNITGQIRSHINTYLGATTGAIRPSMQYDHECDPKLGASFNQYNVLSFDASCSSAVYGKSETAQPASIAVVMWQRIS